MKGTALGEDFAEEQGVTSIKHDLGNQTKLDINKNLWDSTFKSVLLII